MREFNVKLGMALLPFNFLGGAYNETLQSSIPSDSLVEVVISVCQTVQLWDFVMAILEKEEPFK